eukprot:g48667.t1
MILKMTTVKSSLWPQVRSRKQRKRKGHKKFGKNVTEKDKEAQEEAKYQEETRTLVQAATQNISSLSYDNVEVLPDEIAGAPHKGVIDRSLDENHVGELMNNFYTSVKPNDKIEWVGWLQDPKDKVTFEQEFGLDDEDNELMEPPAFCDRDTVNEWTRKWKAAGVIDCKGGKLDWNNIPLDKRTELQTFLRDKMKEGKLHMEAFVGLHTANAIQRLHRIYPTQALWQAETELQIGNAKIMMGDMFKMASLLPSDSAFDCLYADLPYNISELQHDQEEINKDKVKTLLNAFSVVGNSEKRAVVFHCHPSQCNMLVEALSVTGYQTIETVYWYKKNHNYVGDVQKWIKAVEMMLVAFNPKQASFTLNLDQNPVLLRDTSKLEVYLTFASKTARNAGSLRACANGSFFLQLFVNVTGNFCCLGSSTNVIDCESSDEEREAAELRQRRCRSDLLDSSSSEEWEPINALRDLNN